MKRRMLALVATGATLAFLVVAGWAVAATAWRPQSRIGHRPGNWGNLDPTFEKCLTGTSQSPVDISGTVTGSRPALQFRYPDNELVVGNTGHVVEVPIPDDNGNTLKIRNSIYTLQQYHFHAPSEHTLNGQHYDLEVHLVHANAAGRLAWSACS